MEPFANDVPYVVRSTRNRNRREQPPLLGELSPDSLGRKAEASSARSYHDEGYEQTSERGYEIHSRLRLVAPQEHMGYLSTG
jgi:hypothetical protein